MPDLLRAQITFEHDSGLPKDRASNNFWFHAPGGASEAAAQDVAERVRDAFLVDVAPRTENIANQLSPALASAGHTVKVYEYDMATGERLTFDDAPPLYSLPFVMDGTNGSAPNPGGPFPSEVALCVSFRSLAGAVPGGGQFSLPPLSRRRGRVYIGPLNMGVGAGASVSRPTTTAIDIVLAGISVLADDAEANRMVVYSRPFAGRDAISAEARANAGGPARPLPALPARPGQAYFVDQVLCDNSFDTQRRRGEASTTRTTMAV